jgi:RNA polymerase sigma-70 factor (ECF subfamily)
VENTELINALKAGEKWAFEKMVKLFSKKIFNTCLNFLQNVEDAEDVTQEVFVAIFQSIGQFKGESLLSTWIYRISTTQCLSFIRMKNRKKRFSFVQRLFSGENNNPTIDIPHFLHPGIELENKERAKFLFQAIEKLPINQKTAFILHKVEQLSQAEIAEIMQVSISSIESLLFRAKQNLRKYLGEYYDNIENG